MMSNPKQSDNKLSSPRRVSECDSNSILSNESETEKISVGDCRRDCRGSFVAASTDDEGIRVDKSSTDNEIEEVPVSNHHLITHDAIANGDINVVPVPPASQSPMMVGPQHVEPQVAVSKASNVVDCGGEKLSDGHVTITDSHVTVIDDGECRGSYESITATDSQEMVKVLSNEERLLSSPKKKKRARDPPIASPQLCDMAGESSQQVLLEAVPPVADHFQVLSKIGEGTFSSVYLVHLKESPDVKFALKHIVPTSAPCRIENELRCLQVFGGQQHVIGLETCIRHRDHVVFVLPYVKHDKFFDFIPHMTIDETRQYMRALFLALQQVHSHHIIHRDIKPSNFLYNRKDKQYYLVDFGLAHLESGRTGQFKDSNALSSGSRKRSISAPGSSNRLRQSPRLLNKLVKSQDNGTPALTPTPTLPRTPAANARMNGFIHPSPHGLGSVHNTGSHKQLSTQLNQGLQSSSTRRDCFKTPNKRASKPEYFHSQTKRAKKDVKEEKALKRQSTPSAANKTSAKKEDPKREKVKSKSAAKQKTKFEDSCHLEHKDTEVCELCMGRHGQNAPRAGTPGFRAPEVLLKCPHQTTAVDMWSAGVILLCILSGRYPFFRAQDDLTALSQVVGLFGTEVCVKEAKCMGKDLVCKPEIPAMNLKELCQQLRSCLPNEMEKLALPNHIESREEPLLFSNSVSDSTLCYLSSNPSSLINAPESLFDLLYRLLAINPADRITAEAALEHPFITGI